MDDLWSAAERAWAAGAIAWKDTEVWSTRTAGPDVRAEAAAADVTAAHWAEAAVRAAEAAGAARAEAAAAAERPPPAAAAAEQGGGRRHVPRRPVGVEDDMVQAPAVKDVRGPPVYSDAHGLSCFCDDCLNEFDEDG